MTTHEALGKKKEKRHLVEVQFMTASGKVLGLACAVPFASAVEP